MGLKRGLERRHGREIRRTGRSSNICVSLRIDRYRRTLISCGPAKISCVGEGRSGGRQLGDENVRGPGVLRLERIDYREVRRICVTGHIGASVQADSDCDTLTAIAAANER